MRISPWYQFRSAINGPHSMMMYAPEVARCSTALSDSLRFGGNLSDHDTELAIITAARHWDCEYVWASHSAAALRAGARPEAVETIANRGDLEGLTKEEAIIVRYGRELMDDHQVSQETFDAALAQFGEANTIVLGALMGYYSFISCTLLGTVNADQTFGSSALLVKAKGRRHRGKLFSIGRFSSTGGRDGRGALVPEPKGVAAGVDSLVVRPNHYPPGSPTTIRALSPVRCQELPSP